MSKLDDLMREHMKNIVYKENRPFCYLDFINFTLNGNSFGVTQGTFRNKMCNIFKDELELVCYSPMAYYKLKGYNFPNSVTHNHTGDIDKIIHNNTNFTSPSNILGTYFCNLPIYRHIKNLPFGMRSIHDIRLRFNVKGLWSLLSNSTKFQLHTFSKDISVTKFERNNLNVKVTLHHTDTVSVSVGCSFAPIELDINGLMRLSTVLAITEDRIMRIIEEILEITEHSSAPVNIPNYGSWLITIWHLGKDASITYEKKEFCIEYRTAEEVIYRIYDKEWSPNNKRRIRIEKQEYPNQSFVDAMEEELNN